MSDFRIHFDPEDDGFKELARRLKNPTGLNKRLGIRLQNLLQRHFLARNREPNKRGWPKQNFWARIRTATAFTGADEKTATVAVADPAFGAKVRGATIVPKRAKWLTIPVRPEAYGKRARVLNVELFAIFRKGKGWLAAKEGNALRLYYRLLKKVTLQPDPRALPEERNIHAELQKTLQGYFKQAREEGGTA